MRSRLAVIALLVVVLAALAASAAAAPLGEHGGKPITVAMTGAEEAPGPGDPDGSGTARFTINSGEREICYSLTVEDIAPATAAHIHRAPAGEPGPVVVPLDAPTDGSSSNCASVDRALAKDIRQNPEDYYVNVHNAEFPGGAVRGQLG